MNGRGVDTWQGDVVKKPVAELVKVVRAAGFSGIYVDRYGYVDGGKQEVATLSELLLRNRSELEAVLPRPQGTADTGAGRSCRAQAMTLRCV